MTDETQAKNPLEDLVQPYELAMFLTGVYRDEEASNFERVQAAVALSSFWMGVELNRIADMLDRVSFVEPISSADRDQGRLL